MGQNWVAIADLDYNHSNSQTEGAIAESFAKPNFMRSLLVKQQKTKSTLISNYQVDLLVIF
ncbi:MAG: hypothetical protein RMY36_015885 [Nostoc sp. SerVER01]|nr:hypothetical protein [Nostoc sp. SerVER01]MDZ8080347.1 hypothetical protein [Nostoc sp. DcaGUA01]